MEYVEIFSENYVNKDCGFTISSNSQLGKYIYDNDPVAYWVSSGEKTGFDAMIEVEFRTALAGKQRTFDRIAILNCNLADYDIYTYVGVAGWKKVKSVTGGSSSNIFIDTWDLTESDRTDIYRIRLIMSETFPANQEKKVGELLCMQYAYKFPFKGGLPRTDFEVTGSYRKASGNLEQWKIYTSHKYGLHVTANHLAKSDRDNLFNTYYAKYPFVVAPNRTLQDIEIHNCKWVGMWKENFDPKVGIYYSVDLNFEGA